MILLVTVAVKSINLNLRHLATSPVHSVTGTQITLLKRRSAVDAVAAALYHTNHELRYRLGECNLVGCPHHRVYDSISLEWGKQHGVLATRAVRAELTRWTGGSAAENPSKNT